MEGEKLENVNKYLIVLEQLNLPAGNKYEHFRNNLKIIEKYINLNAIQRDTIFYNQLRNFFDKNDANQWEYIGYLFYLVMKIQSLVNFNSTEKENLISMKHLNLCIKVVEEISNLGLRKCLCPIIQCHPIFNGSIGMHPASTLKIDTSPDPVKLKICINLLFEIIKKKEIRNGGGLDTVVLDIMAGIYLILYENPSGEDNKSTISENMVRYLEVLTYIWENISKEKYFRYLLILKSIKQLPPQMQQLLHQDLLRRVTQPRGFEMLVRNLLSSTSSRTGEDESIPNWKKFDVISNIISHRGHSKEFFNTIIDEIFDFIKTSLINEDMIELTPAGVITLRKLYNLNDKNNKWRIAEKVSILFKPLYDPAELLTGAIVFDYGDMKLLLRFLFTCFYGSSLEILQSELLIPYLPLLINIYSQFPKESDEKRQIRMLLVQCLSNREKSDLLHMMRKLLRSDNRPSEKWKFLHPRILIIFNEKFQTYSVQIVPEEMEHSMDVVMNLIDILKTSNNNIFIYNSFISVLKLLDEEFDSNTSTNSTEKKIDLIQDGEEFEEFIARHFKKKTILISFLTYLISYRPFHTQFHENPNEIFTFVQSVLEKRVNLVNSSTLSLPDNEESDQILSIILAILQEFLENSKDPSKHKDFSRILQKFLNRNNNIVTKHQLENIINIIERGTSINMKENDQSNYSFARSLLNETSPHLRVYGIQQIIKLLQERDEETIVNRHALLALSLHILRDEESYTYLNCVRLLVNLINVLEAEVLEALSSEYLNKNETIEYRLKVGEAILKVTEFLGEISYKYKNVLVNCFLGGCKNELDEFRSSSFSNLAALCRLLSYQVHNFFNELLTICENSLQAENYLPAKRATIMVLSQLLAGMDDLMSFQDYLLPIYRLLTFTMENEKDQVTRVHATNGLRSLNEKCREFLLPKHILEKEIKIFGIHDEDNNKKKKANILEII